MNDTPSQCDSLLAPPPSDDTSSQGDLVPAPPARDDTTLFVDADNSDSRKRTATRKEDESTADTKASFPIITMDGFRSALNMNMGTGEDSTPVKKRAKGVDYDEPYDYDHIKPPLHEFTPDDNGRVAGCIATYVGLRKNSSGKKVPFSEDIKRAQATWPWQQQLFGAHVLDSDEVEVHDVFRHENIKIGVFPQMGYWPLYSLYGKPLEWKRNENWNLYCLSTNLMADMFRQLPQLLLEGVAWKTTAGAQPVSEFTAMRQLNEKFAQLPEHLIPSTKQLALTNSRHVVNVVQAISMHLITNHSHKSSNFPLAYMRPPSNEEEKRIDHHLIHFHAGRLSPLGLNGEHMNLNRVRTMFREENGLAKYIGFKRRIAITIQALVENLKEKGNGTKLAIERKLLLFCGHCCLLVTLIVTLQRKETSGITYFTEMQLRTWPSLSSAWGGMKWDIQWTCPVQASPPSYKLPHIARMN